MMETETSLVRAVSLVVHCAGNESGMGSWTATNGLTETGLKNWWQERQLTRPLCVLLLVMSKDHEVMCLTWIAKEKVGILEKFFSFK